MRKFFVVLIALGLHLSTYSLEIPIPDFAKRLIILNFENVLMDFKWLIVKFDLKNDGLHRE